MKKVLDFKTVSPLFEEERDGGKWFTLRRKDTDSRFRALQQWDEDKEWYVRITNPGTGESFIRRIVNVSYLWVKDNYGYVRTLRQRDDWMIIDWSFAGYTEDVLALSSLPSQGVNKENDKT